MLSFIPLINHIHMYTCMFTLTQCVNKYRYQIHFFLSNQIAIDLSLDQKKIFDVHKDLFFMNKKNVLNILSSVFYA